MCVLKMKFLPSAVQKLSPEQTHRQTDRQTDTQTDRQTRLKLLPTAYADGKNVLLWINILHLVVISHNGNNDDKMS